jgi:hypothetical protein
VLDSNKKFTDAALRYYHLSNTQGELEVILSISTPPHLSGGAWTVARGVYCAVLCRDVLCCAIFYVIE